MSVFWALVWAYLGGVVASMPVFYAEAKAEDERRFQGMRFRTGELLDPWVIAVGFGVFWPIMGALIVQDALWERFFRR